MGTQEAGFYGAQLYSLSGKPGSKYRGRQCQTSWISLNNSFQLVFGENGNRISALIILSNVATAPMYISLGQVATGTEQFPLYPGQSFQIDGNFPWTGSVYAQTAGVGVIFATEISVP